MCIADAGVVRGSRLVGIFLENGILDRIIALGENDSFEVKVVIWRCISRAVLNANIRQIERMIDKGWHLCLIEALESFDSRLIKSVVKCLVRIIGVVPRVLFESGLVKVLEGISSECEKVNDQVLLFDLIEYCRGVSNSVC
jgi:hypothetical protein